MIFPDDVATLNAVTSFVNAKGNAATVDGVPAWSLEGDPIGEVTPAEDGLSATIALNGTIGTAQLSVKADADRSGEIRELVLTADIQIVPGEAIAGSINLTVA